MDNLTLELTIKQHIINCAKVEILNYKQDYVGIKYSRANGYYILSGEIYMTYEGGSTGKSIKDFRFCLRPLSDLIKPINWGLSTYEFTSLFKVGDTDGFMYEYDHGNIRLLNDLKSIALFNSYNDINFLPYPVVKMMFEYHFDVFGLIDRGLAVDINTINKLNHEKQ